MHKITNVKAREILDSRGNPTLEVDVLIDNNFLGRASVPSGASTGINEAVELRDLDPKRYFGKGVLKAVANVNEIIKPSLLGMDANEQSKIDERLIALDGTENKSRLGANAILGVSLAVAKAAALANNMPLFKYLNPANTNPILPKPFMNIINGGAHADNKIEIQEFMIMPNMEGRFADKLRAGAEIFYCLKEILKKNGYNTNVGDEGGFAPNLDSANQAIEYILQAITLAGYVPGYDIMLALDCAANEFYDLNLYKLENQSLKSAELIDYYNNLIRQYPIIYLEDPFAETDQQAWKACVEKLSTGPTMIVGDDLFVTNSKLLSQGIEEKLANAILIKPNQIGTLSETIKTINMAKKSGFGTIISHRSGETEDVCISHIAVAFNSGYIKTGSLSRTDRIIKYNELLRIEEFLSA